MKKWIAGILLCCICIVSLNGCANKPAARLEAPSTTAASTPSGTDTPGPSTTGTGDATNPATGEALPTEGQTKPTEPKPTEMPKPAEAPKPTEAPKPVHQHSYKAQTVSATCTSQGYTYEACSCGSQTQAHDYTPALGHDYQATQTVEATPWSAGYTESTCTRCGNSSRTETGALTDAQLEAFRYEVAKATIKYINEYRVQEGSTELTYLPGLSQVAMYRSEQLVTNYKHDSKDIKAAFNHFQYGRYVDATEYGDDASLSYYTDDGNEAIGWNPIHGTADQIGKSIADGLHGSPEHWRYLCSAEYSFAGVGWCPRGYLAVLVSPQNYG